MLDGIFDAWDYDGNGALTLEEILPFYMKSSKSNDVLEPQVRAGFEKFCTSQGLQATDGLTKSAFKTWLSKLTNEQLASHFVRVKGWTSEAYKMNLNLAIVKEYRGKTIKEILDSPVDALRGLSDIGEEALQKLGVKTVREVAVWRPFLLARAIVTLAPTESTDKDAESDAPATGGILKKMNIRNMLDKEFEALPLKQVPDLPVSALSILPPECVEVLHTMRIRTIKHLGQRKYFHWANSMLELEQYEAWSGRPWKAIMPHLSVKVRLVHQAGWLLKIRSHSVGGNCEIGWFNVLKLSMKSCQVVTVSIWQRQSVGTTQVFSLIENEMGSIYLSPGAIAIQDIQVYSNNPHFHAFPVWLHLRFNWPPYFLKTCLHIEKVCLEIGYPKPLLCHCVGPLRLAGAASKEQLLRLRRGTILKWGVSTMGFNVSILSGFLHFRKSPNIFNIFLL